MVVGLAADGDVSLPDLDLADGPLVVVVGSEGNGLSPAGRRDLRPAGVDPDGQPARVAERRRGRLGGALRDRPGARLTAPRPCPGPTPGARPRRRGACSRGCGVRRRLGRARRCGRARAVPAQQPHGRAGQPRRGAAADARRPRRRAHRAGAARPPDRLRAPGRRRDRLGKTDAESTEELVRRYAYIASQPEGQVAKVERGAGSTWPAAAPLRGAVLGLLPVAGLAAARAGTGGASCCGRARGPPGRCVGAGVLALVAGPVWQPWDADDDHASRATGRGCRWRSSSAPGCRCRRRRSGMEVRGDVTTAQTRRLIESAVDTYDKSKRFYRDAAEEAAGPRAAPAAGRRDRGRAGLRPPRQHRHGRGGPRDRRRRRGHRGLRRRRRHLHRQDLGGVLPGLGRRGLRRPRPLGRRRATTTTGRSCTTTSTTAAGRCSTARRSTGPAASRLLGVDDPRSSGLGNWRDETGLSFDEVGHRLADAACAADERVTTVLVHDADLGREALARGCADLVLGGHLHVQDGPDPGRRRERAGRLHLHDRHHRRRGVRHRRRQQAAPRRRGDAGDLPRRPAGRDPAGDAADRRRLRGRRLPPAGPHRRPADARTGPRGRSTAAWRRPPQK